MGDREPTSPQHESVEDYFLSVVHLVFDEFFAMRRARFVDLGLNLVRYETPRWFAEAIYLPMDGPKYSPRVEIGVLPDLFVDPRRNRVDVLYTVPEGNELRQYNLMWRYTTRSEALAVFTRARDE